MKDLFISNFNPGTAGEVETARGTTPARRPEARTLSQAPGSVRRSTTAVPTATQVLASEIGTTVRAGVEASVEASVEAIGSGLAQFGRQILPVARASDERAATTSSQPSRSQAESRRQVRPLEYRGIATRANVDRQSAELADLQDGVPALRRADGTLTSVRVGLAFAGLSRSPSSQGASPRHASDASDGSETAQPQIKVSKRDGSALAQATASASPLGSSPVVASTGVARAASQGGNGVPVARSTSPRPAAGGASLGANQPATDDWLRNVPVQSLTDLASILKKANSPQTLIRSDWFRSHLVRLKVQLVDGNETIGAQNEASLRYNWRFLLNYKEPK